MLHPIDATNDYAFKRLLGDPANADLLIDFLNATLQPPSPVVSVEILNPFNEAEFEDDKLTVVDVKARLSDGRRIQVEVQATTPPQLRERMLYTWADLYREQLARGEDYLELRPAISIWVLPGLLFREEAEEPAPRSPHSCFEVWDPEQEQRLSDHLAIHVLELPRFKPGGELDDLDRWLYFLKESQRWTSLPTELDDPVMRKAMKVLEQISDKEQDYWAYQARQNALRAQATIEKLMARYKTSFEEAKAELERIDAERQRAEEDRQRAEEDKQRAEEDKQRAEEDKQRAEEDARRLAAALRAAGIDPDEILKS